MEDRADVACLLVKSAARVDILNKVNLRSDLYLVCTHGQAFHLIYKSGREVASGRGS